MCPGLPHCDTAGLSPTDTETGRNFWKRDARSLSTQCTNRANVVVGQSRFPVGLTLKAFIPRARVRVPLAMTFRAEPLDVLWRVVLRVVVAVVSFHATCRRSLPAFRAGVWRVWEPVPCALARAADCDGITFPTRTAFSQERRPQASLMAAKRQTQGFRLRPHDAHFPEAAVERLEGNVSRALSYWQAGQIQACSFCDVSLGPSRHNRASLA